MYSVFGVENPLLDYIAHADFAVVEKLGVQPGTMNLVDRDGMERVLGLIREYRNIPGGSCANTIRGIAWQARKNPLPPPVYGGAVGRDGTAGIYRDSMKKAGVTLRLVEKDQPTGCSVVVITPDCERTMFTFLGACREYRVDDLDFDALKSSRILYSTGYMWDTDNQKTAIHQAAECANQEGLTIAFDLADPFAVSRYREQFLAWIPGRVRILFANREELRMLMEMKEEDATVIRLAGELAELVVMKTGSDGCIINHRGVIRRVPAVKIKARDTTAAGDVFAAGFLFAHLRGEPPESAAEKANRLASLIVTVEGCDFDALERMSL